eukprot:TRINITY_DN68013_c8_g3_i1.p1 TRINITY_DN68013_c8_g3~~TRINITY_DN68013_c8_g3_i1.p1  ORF type:complete len:358 (-),score=167.20 TRINITY_DN68013_c8_g3_i1:851-1924(-)
MELHNRESSADSDGLFDVGAGFSFSDGEMVADSDFARSVRDVRAHVREFEALSTITYFSVRQLYVLHDDLFAKISALQIADLLIDAEEFASALGMSPSSLLLKRIFTSFKSSPTTSISFREFVMSMSILSTRASLAEKTRFMFELYDLNKDGFVDKDEVKLLLVDALASCRSDLRLTDQQIEQICDSTVQQIDLDGNGLIDYREFHAMAEKRPQLVAPFTFDIHAYLDSKLHPRHLPQPPSSEELETAAAVDDHGDQGGGEQKKNDDAVTIASSQQSVSQQSPPPPPLRQTVSISVAMDEQDDDDDDDDDNKVQSKAEAAPSAHPPIVKSKLMCVPLFAKDVRAVLVTDVDQIMQTF